MTVTNIPTEEDFYTSGTELLDFSWDVVARLLTDIDEAEYFGVDPEEISDNYWAAAKRRLTTSLAITQQGVEFILKGKIAAISPFLLITDAPAKWPSPYEGEPIKFSEFRTVDAQDLIRVLDTFSSALFQIILLSSSTSLGKSATTLCIRWISGLRWMWQR